MINLSFFLKYKSQLRRTRPDSVREIDDFLTRSIIDAGGKITGSRLVFSAVFDEDVIGFWLDVYVIIENLRKIIEESSDFYGYSLVVCSVNENIESLSRSLANGDGGTFMDAMLVKKFAAYASFEKPSEWLKEKKIRKGCNNFYRIKELKTFKSNLINDGELQKDIYECLCNEFPEKNVLIVGKDLFNIRAAFYAWCKEANGEFPPLVICFGSTGIGVLLDIWSSDIRSLDSTQHPDEIDNLWEFLFRERLRDEVSEYIIRCVKKFLSLLYEYYFSAARRKKKTAVIILENIHLAGNNIANLFIESLDAINKQKIFIVATAEDDTSERKFTQKENLFGILKRAESKDIILNVPYL